MNTQLHEQMIQLGFNRFIHDEYFGKYHSVYTNDKHLFVCFDSFSLFNDNRIRAVIWNKKTNIREGFAIVDDTSEFFAKLKPTV
jgi:hypothetical protein